MSKIEALLELGFTRDEILDRVLGPGQNAPLLCNVGDKVLIETPTKYWSGCVSSCNATEIHLVDAAWIANTGRFQQAIATGDFDEVEPCGSVTIACGAVMAIVAIPKLPTVQK